MNELKVSTVIKETEILGKKIALYGSVVNPLFLASDVAYWIEHSNSRMMLKSIDEDEKEVNIVYTLGGNQEKWFLTENGLYEVCMQSRKPIAKQMKKEIKSYLKQIRLTGGIVQENREEEFVNNNFSSFSDDTKKLMVSDLIKSNEEYKKRISELEPDAELAQNLMQRKGLLTLKEVADSIEVGRTKLCSLLREKKVLSKQTGFNEPMGKYIKSSYFKTVVEEDERKHISIVTLVTPQGLRFIYRLIKKNQLLDEFNTAPLQEVHA